MTPLLDELPELLEDAPLDEEPLEDELLDEPDELLVPAGGGPRPLPPQAVSTALNTAISTSARIPMSPVYGHCHRPAIVEFEAWRGDR